MKINKIRLVYFYSIGVLFILSFNLNSNFVYGKTHDSSSFLICSPKINCPSPQGICTRDNKCLCLDGYTTVTDYDFEGFQCNYLQKSQAITFLLEFIIGFGVGHFYLGNIGIAVVKLIFCFFTAFIICLSPYFSITMKNKILRHLVPYLQSIFGMIYCIWQVVDGVLIGLSYYKDSNGIEMAEW
jgi:hypothetical protein